MKEKIEDKYIKPISGEYLKMVRYNLFSDDSVTIYSKTNDDFSSILNSIKTKKDDILKSISNNGRYAYNFMIEDLEYGNVLNCRCRVLPAKFDIEGNLEEVLITFQDINEEVLRQNYVEDIFSRNNTLKYLDDLTQTFNRSGFIKKALELLSLGKKEKYCICYADISRFGNINKRYGEKIGDKILERFGKSCLNLVNDKSIVGRFGEDKFVILYSLNKKKETHSDVSKLLENILIDINSNQQLSNLSLNNISANFGVYLLNKTDMENPNLDNMISSAKHACKIAKDNVNEYISFYNVDEWNKSERRILIDLGLTNALKNNEIVAYFQPQYDYLNNKVIGAEVLCRWNSKELGNISPLEFIPVLEESNRIVELDKYMWELTCKTLRNWIDNNKKYVPLSINVSKKDINCINVVSVLNDLINKYDLSSNMISVEITENSYVDDKNKIVSILKDLQDSGFKVEMDDFGSGYSSLNMLKEVPVDVLKLDLRFFTPENIESRGGSIVSSVIRMAQGLNMSIIAEGVETKEQADILKNMSCYTMQGYYFAKPMPKDEFEKFLEKEDTIVFENKKDNVDGVKYINEIIDPNTNCSFIFNNYSGSSGIFELNKNGALEIIWVNEEFLRNIKSDQNINSLKIKESLLKIFNDIDSIPYNSIKESIDDGVSDCEFYISDIDVWVKFSFRHIFSTPSSYYLFASALNVTENHNTITTLNKFIEQVSKQIGMVPIGTFKYEADGNQEFDFISSGILSILNYNSEDEFREKFNNRFPDMVYYEDRDKTLRGIDEQIAITGYDDWCEYRIETGDGKLKMFYDIGKLVIDEKGKRWFYVAIADLEQVSDMLNNKNVLEKKDHTTKLIPGIITFEYDYTTKKLITYRIRNGKELVREFDDFFDNMLIEGWASKETNDKVISLFSSPYNDILEGSFEFVGDFTGLGNATYLLNYASVKDIKGNIVKIVGNLVKKEV